MNNQNLIIYDNKILYSIFFELKDLLNFQLYFKSQKETFELENKELNNCLILTTTKIENIDNQLIIDQFPYKIIKLVEKINITFLKQKFNEQSKIKTKNYKINLNSREIISKDKKLKLTEKEVTTILYLLNAHKEVSVSELQDKVWQYQEELETHTVETHIHRLRKKIFETFGDNSFIISKKNGYKID